MAKIKNEDAQVDLTPMIDVVFQLIIFFIVTIKMEDTLNEEIILEDSLHGPEIESREPYSSVIEIDKRGRFSMNGIPVKQTSLKNMLINKYKRVRRQFPVYVRADYRTKHKDVKKVMDICTGAGIWRINFVAVKEHKATKSRHKGF